ncbi:1-phosphatidylinositol 4,5-bisphosphate phosphodiesterase delta-4 [Dinochytrium kinnereticum]|nr:1-phosphatidylinositol 4,5-bisphosphate phosphodiesterase delta-4 [Dinochytrium kinnereticum]
MAPPHSIPLDFPDSVVLQRNSTSRRGSSPSIPSLPSPDLENLLPTPPSLSGRESPADAEAIQNILIMGTRMMKYPNKASSRPEERVIKVNLLPLQVSWESKKKKSTHSTADVHSIREIRLGQNTKAFEMHGKAPGIDDRAFTVIYVAGGKYKMLNLVAPTKEYCELWVTGLHMLLAQADGNPFQTNMRSWLRRMWKEVDTTGRDRLDLDEVTVLMKRLNIRLSKIEIKSTFKQADISKQGFISYYNFERLYRALRFRPEIAEVFSMLAKANSPFITHEEFERFLLEIQKTGWTTARCLEVYKKYCPADSEGMDLEHFSAFLISANNGIFRKAHSEVHMDMGRPLNEYFINSSHNTTGRILFRDAIEAINRYAFVSSPYPLILSLELHCSIEQQNVMVAIMQEFFSESLLTKPLGDNETRLPSPEALKYKILLKAKRKMPGNVGDESEYETEEEEIDSSWDVLQRESQLKTDTQPSPVLRRPRALSRRNASSLNPVSASYPCLTSDGLISPIGAHSHSAEELLAPPTPNASPPMNQVGSAPTSTSMSAIPAALAASSLARRKSFNDELKKKASIGRRKFCISKNLSDLVVYCKGIRFEGLGNLKSLAFDEMFSIAESRALPLISKHRDDITQFSLTHLSRVYPAPMRVSSSNFDPTIFWSTGIQMVAMNFQTFDRGMQVNRALFMGNGRSGFILKPPVAAGMTTSSPFLGLEGADMRESVLSGGRGGRTLTVLLISAHQLPKAKEDNEGSVLDPFVDIEVVCPDFDVVRFRTKPISGSGFNPTWKETFRFPVGTNPLTFVRFQVSDGDAKLTNEVIGTYTILLSNMELGYRHVPLLNRRGEVIRFSTLFVHIDVS